MTRSDGRRNTSRTNGAKGGRAGLGTDGGKGVRVQVVLSQETVAEMDARKLGDRATSARLLIRDGLRRLREEKPL